MLPVVYPWTKIDIEATMPENCQFFVDETSRGSFVKFTNLVYAICALDWNTHL